MKEKRIAGGGRRTEHKFSEVPTATIPRSQFNRSHDHKTTFDAGYLIPIYVDEVLPGDTYNLNLSAFARLATPIYPLMDSLRLTYFFFFVPWRIIWDNFPRFMGEQINPGDSTDFTIPQITSATGGTALDNADYMGIPPGRTNTTVSALPFRALHAIYNEWFRDQNLQDRVVLDKDDGPDTWSDYNTLLRRGKRHDYFTSGLPWPQKGPGVELPLGGTIPIERVSSTSIPGLEAEDSTPSRHAMVLNQPGFTGNDNVAISGQISDHDVNSTGSDLYWGTDVGLQADLSTSTAVTINSMREAIQLQKLLERDARGGTRYIELVKAHFQVTSPDARLQRPEYLGGGIAPITVNSVPFTNIIASLTPGILGAYATSSASGIGFNKSFVEHGTIIGLVSAQADLTYQQGLHRMWSRNTKYDIFWPALAHLGEQEVLNKEIYFQDHDAGAPDNDLVFAYQERWAEYRYNPSRISGQFRSEHATPLDAWHLAQEFDSLPVLGADFIVDEPPVDRVIAVPAQPHFIFDSHFEIKCARPLPVYSVPGLVDHF